MPRIIIPLLSIVFLSACSTPEPQLEYESKPSPIVTQNIFVTSWEEESIDLDTIECIDDWIPFLLRTKQHTDGRKVSIIKCVPPKS